MEFFFIRFLWNLIYKIHMENNQEVAESSWRMYNFCQNNPNCSSVCFGSAGFPNYGKQPIANLTSSGMLLDYVH